LAKTGMINEAKYADTAIGVLIDQLLKKGAQRRHLKAKIAGGAQMFQFASSNDLMRIGPRNVEAVKHELKKNGIPLMERMLAVIMDEQSSLTRKRAFSKYAQSTVGLWNCSLIKNRLL
jgi:hypothetical protein